MAAWGNRANAADNPLTWNDRKETEPNDRVDDQAACRKIRVLMLNYLVKSRHFPLQLRTDVAGERVVVRWQGSQEQGGTILDFSIGLWHRRENNVTLFHSPGSVP